MRSASQNVLIVSVAITLLAAARLGSPQMTSSSRPGYSAHERYSQSVCAAADVDSAAGGAFQLVCRQGPVIHARLSGVETIVVGFVGGFVKPNDVKHPDVLFAAYLREHYSSNVHAEVFSNHDRRGALHYVMQLLDTNHDGVLSDQEKRNARIIIYGHSWGASETVAFARELLQHGIPILLTIQIDIVTKFRQRPHRIPPNVERAVNFYETEGVLHGREISASDATRTDVIGNFRMGYSHRHINCNNYSWFARTFNRPHHEIENDPVVWEKVASLINTEISSSNRVNDQANIVTGGEKVSQEVQ